VGGGGRGTSSWETGEKERKKEKPAESERSKACQRAKRAGEECVVANKANDGKKKKKWQR